MLVYIIPFITALAGCVIIQIAIKTFLSTGNIQNIFLQSGGIIADELMQSTDVTGQLKDPEKLKALTPMIEAHLDTFLQIKLQEKLPVIATFVGESTMAKIKEAMIEEIDLLLPNVIAEYADSLSKTTDIRVQVNSKLKQIPADKLMPVFRAPVRLIGFAGCIIGFISGLIAVLMTQIYE